MNMNKLFGRNMKQTMQKKYVLGTLGALAVLFGGVGYTYISAKPNNLAAGLRFSDLEDGTKIQYKVFANGHVVDQGLRTVDSEKEINLSVNEDAPNYDPDSILSYQLQVKPPADEAETLDMLVKLDQNSGDINFSGSGFNELSPIQVQKGDKIEVLSSDWSGGFSAPSVNNFKDESGSIKKSPLIQMAFQNAGIKGDLSELGNGKLEVFFGDSSADNIDDVQVRYTRLLAHKMRDLAAVMVMQTEIIGMFMDASIQMKTQRKLQELHARAHKDYHPSEHMCRVGSFMRSIAHSESKSDLEKHALNTMLMNQYLGVQGSTSSTGPRKDELAQISNYQNHFCNPVDNDSKANALCPAPASTAADLEQRNKDIDYTRTLAGPLTLDIAFADESGAGGSNALSEDERDVVALARNLYFPDAFNVEDSATMEKDFRGQNAGRRWAAQMNVAHSSFINIAGMKARAPIGQQRTTDATTPPPAPLGTGVAPVDPAGATDPNAVGGLQTALLTTRDPAPAAITEDAGWIYMKALFREFGIDPVDTNGDGTADLTVEEQIDEMLGERPSYYAQMEVLTKKIYQSPNFFTNLYDKPANVERIGASLDAIGLMNQRDRFESILRREMLSAILVEDALEAPAQDVSTRIYENMQQNQFD